MAWPLRLHVLRLPTQMLTSVPWLLQSTVGLFRRGVPTGSNNLPAPPVVHTRHQQAQITHKRIGGNSCTSFTENPCAPHSPLQTSPKTPARLRAARWPRESRRRPHRQVRETGGRGKRKRRNSRTLNNAESMRVAGFERVADIAAPAAGPLCDPNKVHDSWFPDTDE